MIDIAAPHLEVERLVLPIGGIPVACAGGELLAAVIEGERWSNFHGRAATLALRDVRVPAGRVAVGVHELRAVGFDLQLAAGHWEIAATRLDATDVRVEILAGGGEPATGGSPNLGFLDAVDGDLEVAVTINVRVPVLGGVTATRRFHISIQDGSIDYRALEHALPWVEDALLDFVLRGDRLVLQRNLPPGPGDEKELVAWPLDDEGLALARAGRVRLRTLPFFTRRRREKQRAGHDTAVAVGGIDIEIARAELRFAEAPTIAIGSRVRVRLGDGATAIVSRGAIRHRQDGPRLGIELQLSTS